MSAAQTRHAARESLAVGVATPIGGLFPAMAALSPLCGVLGAEPAALPQLPEPAAAMALPNVLVDSEVAANPCADEEVRAHLEAGEGAAAVASFG